MPCFNPQLFYALTKGKESPLARLKHRCDKLVRQCDTLNEFIQSDQALAAWPGCLSPRMKARRRELMELLRQDITPGERHIAMQKLKHIHRYVGRVLKTQTARRIEAECAYLTARALA